MNSFAVVPALSALSLILVSPVHAQEAANGDPGAEVSEPAVPPEEPTQDGDEAEMMDFPTEEEEALQELEREITESFALFGELFQVEPLTPEQEELIPLAQQMTDIILPEGTFGLVMQDSLEPMFDTIMGAMASDPRFRLAEVTGVDSLDLDELEDEAAREALEIFDPEFAMRNEKMGDLVLELVSEMFSAMEPSYRTAYTRALATRFEEQEMRDLLVFFETPLGAKFAVNSFSIQYDPQMLGVMEQMGPAMVEVMPDMMERFSTFEEQFEKERKFSELSSAERDRAAQLLGKSVNELEALEPQDNDEIIEDDANEYEEV